MRFVLLALFVMIGCTDAEWEQYATLGESGEIVCYSGGKEIYRGRSTGKIETESHSDGWFLKDASTGKLVRVSGDCVIQN